MTDIDDKIIRRAQENGESIEALTGRFIRFMDEDAAALLRALFADGPSVAEPEPRRLAS